MDQHLLLALVNPLPGREDAFNEWYDGTHVHEVLTVPGFTAVQRFRLGQHQRPDQAPPPWRYLALYEVDADDPDIHAAVSRAAASGTVRLPDEPVFAPDTATWLFSPVGPRIARAPRP